jgi:hypothetical protein
MSYDANHDVAILVEHFKRIAAKQPDGSYKCTFKDVFKDEQLEQLLESLVGTMKAAKKKGLLNFKGEMLLQGAHDSVEITMPAGV